MPKGLYGMSSVTDGKNIYVINGMTPHSPLRPVSYKSSRLNILNGSIPECTNEIYVYNTVKDEWSIYPDRISAKAFNGTNNQRGHRSFSMDNIKSKMKF